METMKNYINLSLKQNIMRYCDHIRNIGSNVIRKEHENNRR